MADIAMCSGEGCPIKKKCYRFTAPKSDWQYYSSFHYNKDTKSCPDFSDNNGYHRIKNEHKK